MSEAIWSTEYSSCWLLLIVYTLKRWSIFYKIIIDRSFSFLLSYKFIDDKNASLQIMVNVPFYSKIKERGPFSQPKEKKQKW